MYTGGDIRLPTKDGYPDHYVVYVADKVNRLRQSMAFSSMIFDASCMEGIFEYIIVSLEDGKCLAAADADPESSRCLWALYDEVAMQLYLQLKPLVSDEISASFAFHKGISSSDFVFTLVELE